MKTTVPIVLVIGYTGSGKTKTLNSLCGVPNTFKVGDNLKSETEKTIAKALNWKNSKIQFVGIDTPGVADSQGRDSQHISEMVDELKKLQKVNGIFIVLNSKQKRLDSNLKGMFKIFSQVFGDDFIKITGIIFSNWSQNKREINDRKDMTESKLAAEINNELRSLGLKIDQDRECFFIDNSIQDLTQKQIIEYSAQEEVDYFNKTIDRIEKFVEMQQPFSLKDIKQCLAEKDQLNNNILELERKIKIIEEEKKQQKDEFEVEKKDLLEKIKKFMNENQEINENLRNLLQISEMWKNEKEQVEKELLQQKASQKLIELNNSQPEYLDIELVVEQSWFSWKNIGIALGILASIGLVILAVCKK